MYHLNEATAPGRHAFTGFDISSALFPSYAPSNISFHLLDAREHCPAEFEGKFYVVHIRFLVGGMAHDDWAKVVRCAKDMLKPGGALMWTELRLRDAVPVLRDQTKSTRNDLEKFCQRFLDILGNRLDAGVSTLQDVLVEVIGADTERGASILTRV